MGSLNVFDRHIRPTLLGRHNDHGGVSNHQPRGCLLICLFRRRWKKLQSPASLAFVRGIHRDRWIPRTKGQLRGKCFHLMTSSCWSAHPTEAEYSTLLLHDVICYKLDMISALIYLVQRWNEITWFTKRSCEVTMMKLAFSNDDKDINSWPNSKPVGTSVDELHPCNVTMAQRIPCVRSIEPHRVGSNPRPALDIFNPFYHIAIWVTTVPVSRSWPNDKLHHIEIMNIRYESIICNSGWSF